MNTNEQIRDALEAVLKCISLIKTCTVSMDGKHNILNYEKQIKAALALPRRQCDVGTPEEQAKRMDAYCASHGERIDGGWRCDNCPLCSIDRCDLVWAQMPYEAKEGGAK